MYEGIHELNTYIYEKMGNFNLHLQRKLSCHFNFLLSTTMYVNVRAYLRLDFLESCVKYAMPFQK